jgi:multidrug resistance efflux pump
VIVSVILCALLLALGVFTFQRLAALKKPPARSETVAPRLAVRVLEPRPERYHEMLTGYGRTRALRQTTIVAEVPGAVTWIDPQLQLGVEVELDQKLLTINSRDLTAGVEAQSALVEQAEAQKQKLLSERGALTQQLAVAKRDVTASRAELSRVADLVKKSFATPSDLDRQRLQNGALERQVIQLTMREQTIENDLALVAAQSKGAAATLRKIAHDLERTVVKAPFAGRIEARHVTLGTRLAPGQPLLKITDPRRVEVAVELGASRYPDVTVGASMKLRLREGGEVVFEGKVERRSPSIDARNRTFTVYVSLGHVSETEVTPSKIPPGAFVIAEVGGRAFEDVVAVPRTAFDGAILYVAVPTDPDAEESAAGGEEPDAQVYRVEARRPQIAAWLPEVALVAGGLEPLDRICVTGIEQIAEGTLVRIVASEPSEADTAGLTPSTGEASR